MKHAALAAAAGITIVLAACTPSAVKNSAPPIKTLQNQKEPSPDKLAIIQSEEVAPDPQKALENYRKLLELKADSDKRLEAEKRVADLQVQEEDVKGNNDGKSAAIRDSINIYQKLLQDPDSKSNDRVLYQLSRAYVNSGDQDKGIETLQKLEHDYPSSPLIADARFRNGELLYIRDRYSESEGEYRKVMDLGENTPFFVQAQHKYGWSLFQQQKYAEDIGVFFAILDRDLPKGELDDPEAALKATTPAEKADLARDSLRVSSLSFTALGGGKAINDYFARNTQPRFYALVYNALGELMLDKRRYTDAAKAYGAFVESHPTHPSAPQFQTKVIAAYRDGGFTDQVLLEKERYATAYEPSAPYWAGKTPTPEVMTALRSDLEDLGRHYQAKAQQEPATDPAAKRADFIAGAGWYKKILDIYPQDPKLPEVNLLYADSLYDGGQTQDAAKQYEKTAYGYPNNPKAPEAAYAAIQAWQRLGKEVQPQDRPGVLRQSVAASTRYADTFPSAPQVAPVLTRSAEDLYEIKDLDQATAMSNRVLALNPPAIPELRSQSLGVLADSKFAQNKYGDAEGAYTQLLALTPPGNANHKLVVEQLAASIYKQGEAARSAGDLRTAAQMFQRVGQVVPEASIRPNADYDAASALYSLQDWGASEQALESFRSRYPTNALAADVDKKLALAYQKDNKPAQAATAYQRIAQRPTENPDTRRESTWLAATLYDQAQQTQLAGSAYESYLKTYPQPLDRSVQARHRLIEMAQASGNTSRYMSLLRDAVTADSMAGAARTEDSKLAAAQASLELGKAVAQQARAVAITQPLAKTLAARKKATEDAVQALNQTASYGYADTTTAATYEIGNAYHDFARALVNSEPPAKLKGADELEQYKLLLEEQADPFDEQAVKAHEANLDRVGQGLWNPSIRKSVDALGELSPAKYGKHEQREDKYESLR